MSEVEKWKTLEGETIVEKWARIDQFGKNESDLIEDTRISATWKTSGEVVAGA